MILAQSSLCNSIYDGFSFNYCYHESDLIIISGFEWYLIVYHDIGYDNLLLLIYSTLWDMICILFFVWSVG